MKIAVVKLSEICNANFGVEVVKISGCSLRLAGVYFAPDWLVEGTGRGRKRDLDGTVNQAELRDVGSIAWRGCLTLPLSLRRGYHFLH